MAKGRAGGRAARDPLQPEGRRPRQAPLGEESCPDRLSLDCEVTGAPKSSAASPAPTPEVEEPAPSASPTIDLAAIPPSRIEWQELLIRRRAAARAKGKNVEEG